MQILPVVKLVAGIATSFGAGTVVGHAIKATTPANMKTATKVLVAVGGFVFAAAAGDLAANWVEDEIDSSVNFSKNLKETASKVKEATADAFKKADEAVKEATKLPEKDELPDSPDHD